MLKIRHISERMRRAQLALYLGKNPLARAFFVELLFGPKTQSYFSSREFKLYYGFDVGIQKGNVKYYENKLNSFFPELIISKKKRKNRFYMLGQTPLASHAHRIYHLILFTEDCMKDIYYRMNSWDDYMKKGYVEMPKTLNVPKSHKRNIPTLKKIKEGYLPALRKELYTVILKDIKDTNKYFTEPPKPKAFEFFDDYFKIFPEYLFGTLEKQDKIFKHAKNKAFNILTTLKSDYENAGINLAQDREKFEFLLNPLEHIKKNPDRY